MNDHPYYLTIPLETLGPGKWEVRAHRFDSETTARAEWRRLEELAASGGYFSVWSVRVPESGEWLVVACGAPEEVPELGGDPYELDYHNALYFATRRAHVGARAEQTGASDHFQVAHYRESGGRIIEADGSVRVPTELETTTGRRSL